MISPAQEIQFQQLIQSPTISANAISGFQAASNPTTLGIDISFQLTNLTGISSITLLRNYVLDPATATVLQSWNPVLADYTWSDTDTALQQQASAYYWLILSPMGTSGTAVQVGPQNILLNPALGEPLPVASISASHGPASNGVVTVTVNVTTDAPSIKIYVQGYHGNTALVAVAQQSTSPIQFTLDATGETVTLKAIAVSAGGTEAATGPTTTLTLNGTGTVPATVQGVIITQISTGNQVSFPASKDAGSTYKIYRAQRGDSFLSASLLATVTSTAGTVEYLDTGGLAGDWEYFIVATNGVGDSLPSDPAWPIVFYSSATLPPNVPINTTNQAIIDSVDGGTSVVVRIYGPSGVGTSYTRIAGYGSVTRPNGTITGLFYSTLYVILWTGSSYVAETSYFTTLPDGYEFVGSITTTAPTGTVGSGATFSMVIDGSGHVIQANPVTIGSGYPFATTAISGGGGTDAQVQPNVSPTGTIPSYTVLNGGSGYTSVPTGTVIPGSSGGTTGGGGANGTAAGSRNGTDLP